MTREEAKKWLNELYVRSDITDDYGDMVDMQPYEEAVDMAIKALEQEPILDKIRADIENMEIVYSICANYKDERTDEEKVIDWGKMYKKMFLDIIDMYRTESEAESENTGRD